jgi:hypothetical protein
VKTLILAGLTVMLAACATNEVPMSSAVKPATGSAKPNSILANSETFHFTKTLSPGGGKVAAEVIPLPSRTQSTPLYFDIDLQLTVNRFDIRWVPNVGACLGAKNRRPEACIFLVRYEDGEPLFATGSLMPEAGPPIQRTDVSAGLAPTDVHRIRVSITRTTVTFNLSDGSSYAQELTQEIEQLRFSCSSAECKTAKIPNQLRQQ